MKKDGRYRFTLQFGSDTEEQIKAGELLERLGNRKSTIIVEALNEYLFSHPELLDSNSKVEVKVAAGYSQTQIEQIIKKMVDDRIANLQLDRIQKDTSQDQIPDIPDTLEDDIGQMLDNLDLFL